MKDYFEQRQEHVERILRELINLLPSSYNKETNDTNYYKILRALAQELADTRTEIDVVRDNNYLDTVHPDAIYNNFGVLVRLSKNPEWDDEKYRSLVKGVIQSLLIGPTKDSLIKAFRLFTNFNVKVYELYKDADKIDPAIYEGINFNPKYTFLLEIEKPLDSTYVDNKTIQRDANYIIGILKPAHTIGLQIVNLTGDEDFRYYYAVDKKVHELAEELVEEKIKSKINELVGQNIDDLVDNYASNNNISKNEASDTIYISNYGMTRFEFERFLKRKSKQLYDEYLSKFEDNPNSLNENDNLVPTLTFEYFDNIVHEVLRNEFNSITHAKIVSNIEVPNITSYETKVKFVHGENGLFSFNIGNYLIELNLFLRSIKLIDLKTNKELQKEQLGLNFRVNGEFKLKVIINENKLNILFNDNNLISYNVVFNNWSLGYQIGRDCFEIYDTFIDNKTILEIEREFNSENPTLFWNISSGNLFQKNDIKYLLVPGLVDKLFLEQYEEELQEKYKYEIIERSYIEIEKLKELNSPIHDEDELREEIVSRLKESLFRDTIIESLGGRDALYKFCLAEASKFKDGFELIYETRNKYLGMDKLEVLEGGTNYKEGQYGWKHLTYKGQLTTSISLEGPKIGGNDLIGPRYTLYDDSKIVSDTNHSNHIILKSLPMLKLSPFVIDEKGRYVISEEGSGLDQSRILGFNENGQPKFVNRIVSIEKSKQPENRIDTQDYEEDALYSDYKANPANELNAQKFEEPDEEMIPNRETDEDFNFLKIRNFTFKLNRDKTNDFSVTIGTSSINIEEYTVDYGFEEKIELTLNPQTFKLNSSCLNSKESILGDYKFDDFSIENSYSEKDILDVDEVSQSYQRVTKEEEFHISPIREIIKNNPSLIGVDKEQFDPIDNVNLILEEDTEFRKEFAPIKLNKSKLNNTEERLTNVAKFKDEIDIEFNSNYNEIKEEQVSEFGREFSERFFVSTIRLFILNSKLNYLGDKEYKLGYDIEQHVDEAELVMSKVDSEGNEIIVKRMVI